MNTQKRIDAITGMLQACADSVGAIASDMNDTGYEMEKSGDLIPSEDAYIKERQLQGHAEAIKWIINALENEKW